MSITDLKLSNQAIERRIRAFLNSDGANVPEAISLAGEQIFADIYEHRGYTLWRNNHPNIAVNVYGRRAGGARRGYHVTTINGGTKYTRGNHIVDKFINDCKVNELAPYEVVVDISLKVMRVKPLYNAGWCSSNIESSDAPYDLSKKYRED